MSVGLLGSEAASGLGRAPLSSPTCLIVEDQALITLSLEAYLEEIGFGACETFSSGAEVVAWLTRNAPTVAILDYSLRDGPGTGLARTLRERGVPFVICSGHRPQVTPPELRDVPWLSKPCDRAALLVALTHAAPPLARTSPTATA